MSSKHPLSVAPTNSYFLHSRKVSAKKRPQSANRTNLALANTSVKSGFKVMESFKSPGMSMSSKNRAIMPNNNLIGSAPTQKHRRLNYA